MTYTIALWPGDGVGSEVIAEAQKVLNALHLQFEFTTFHWNARRYVMAGSYVPEDYLEVLKSFDAILLGALGDQAHAPDYVSLEPLLGIRKGFDQYVNVRPAILYPGVDCPLVGKQPYDIDMVIVRENTEGEYTTLGGRHHAGMPEETAMQISYFTRHGTERVIRYAFELAKTRKRKHVTNITKSNALCYSMVFWDEVFAEVARHYPEVQHSTMLVDAAAMHFVREPECFDVVVASNLFGDILSDLSAGVIGGMGFAGSANLNPERRFPPLFEPVHGSAPDIACTGQANPIAAILSVAMMLDFLGEKESAERLHTAVKDHLLEGNVRTSDRGGRHTTSDVGDDIVRRIS